MLNKIFYFSIGMKVVSQLGHIFRIKLSKSTRSVSNSFSSKVCVETWQKLAFAKKWPKQAA